jgi:hypothetical protein
MCGTRSIYAKTQANARTAETAQNISRFPRPVNPLACTGMPLPEARAITSCRNARPHVLGIAFRVNPGMTVGLSARAAAGIMKKSIPAQNLLAGIRSNAHGPLGGTLRSRIREIESSSVR